MANLPLNIDYYLNKPDRGHWKRTIGISKAEFEEVAKKNKILNDKFKYDKRIQPAKKSITTVDPSRTFQLKPKTIRSLIWQH